MPEYVCACETVLGDKGNYHFCPICGRPAARLNLPRELVPPPLKPGARSLVICPEKEGPGSLRLRLTAQTEGIRLEDGRTEILLDGDPRPVTLRLEEGAPRLLLGHLRAGAPTGDRREEWWKPEIWEYHDVPFRITTSTPAQPVVPAQCLVFPEDQPRQVLYIANPGDEEARVMLQAPAGFTVDGETGRVTATTVTVPPRQHAEVSLIRTAGAETGSLRLQWDGGEQEVTLEGVQQQAGGFCPDYVIGIDFGSVNTSVRLRDLKSGEIVPLGPRDHKGQILPRFPSALWVPQKPGERLLIGQEAVNRSLTHPGAGFLVKGIKTLIRLEEDPFLSYGPQWTTEHLLVHFLRSLKSIIEEGARERGIEDCGNVLYVFCLPVLDAGPQYEAQKERMRRAAVEAGFPADDDDVTWFIEEPVAAALAVVRDLHARSGLEPDTHFCVVDAGGSTTDVTVGQVYLDRRHRYRFRPERTFALHFELPQGELRQNYERIWRLEGVQGVAAESEVGGQMVDRLLAAEWIKPGGTFPDELWEQLWPEETYEGAAERRPQLNSRFWSVMDGVEKLKQHLCDTPDQRFSLPGRIVWTWFLHRADTKIVQERLQARAEELFRTAPRLSHEADIAPLIEKLWDGRGVGPLLHSMLAEYGKSIRAVVAAGGGNLVPAQRKAICHWTGAPDEELTTERSLLVIEGSVLAYDLAPTGSLDCSIWLEIESMDGTGQMEILGAYRRASAARSVLRTYTLTAGDMLRVTVKARVGHGEETALATCPVYGGTCQEVGVVSRHDPSGTLRLLLRRDSAECPIWELRL